MNGNTARFTRDLAGGSVLPLRPYAAEELHQIDDVVTLGRERPRSSGFAGFFLTIGGATVVPVGPGRPLAGHFPAPPATPSSAFAVPSLRPYLDDTGTGSNACGLILQTRVRRAKFGPFLLKPEDERQEMSVWARSFSAVLIVLPFCLSALSDPLPPDLTYRPLPTLPFSRVKAADEATKAAVMQRQSDLLNERYDLSDRGMQNVRMSGGRKPVQQGVRVKLPAGVTWETLGTIPPDEIRQKDLLPAGFLPLPHVKHATGGQVFPDRQIDEIRRQEGRDLRRFDVNFDFPDHLTPEFPPPIFLTTRPELGDVSRGQLLTIRNFYEVMGE
jgi:hypothetical protein